LSTLYAICSSGGITLSYRPLLRTEALLVTDEQVLSFGPCRSVEEVASKLDAVMLRVDGYVLPGFVDAHLHIDSLGFELSSLSMIGVRSREELLERIKSLEPNIGDWIVVGRFDHLVFPDQKPPTRHELDDIVPHNPVLLVHRSGHMGVLNSEGLRRVKHVLGEYVDYERGWIYERALWSVRSFVFSQLSVRDRVNLVKVADEHLWSMGVTAAGVAGATPELLEALREAAKDLHVRLYVYVYFESFKSIEEIWRAYLEAKLSRSRVEIRGVKVFADGALGPRTAYLSKPYSDSQETRGNLLITREQLEAVIREASAHGLQVAVHVIGDAALDVVLEALSKYPAEVQLLRHRIEHASLVRDDQLERIKELKPTVVVQPHFIITDTWILERVGLERVKWVYRYRTLQEITRVAYSTDAPVEPANPWETIYAAVTRGVREGLRHSVLTSDEAVSLVDALHAYTREAGYALGDDRLGCLLPGCYPDMIVVDRDPLEIRDPAELLEITSRPLAPWLSKR